MLTACDFLDEYNPNSVTVGNYYTSEEDIVASLNGVYTSLTQSYVADNYHYFTDVRANATVVTNSGANSGIPYQFYNYTLPEENVYVYNRYSQLYKIISRANTLFAHLGDVSYATPSARDTYEAEARFLRALSYYWLVTEWGDVPLVLNSIDIDEGKAMGRTEKSKVLQAIYEDFDAAASVLPEKCTGAVRATKGAALALKARVALIMGDWQTAANAANAVMQLGVYALHPDYANLFLSTTKTSDEFIFKIPRSVEYDGWYYGASAVYNDLVRNVGGWCATCPSWDLLAAYTCTDGLPVD